MLAQNRIITKVEVSNKLIDKPEESNILILFMEHWFAASLCNLSKPILEIIFLVERCFEWKIKRDSNFEFCYNSPN